MFCFLSLNSRRTVRQQNTLTVSYLCLSETLLYLTDFLIESRKKQHKMFKMNYNIYYHTVIK